MTNGITRRAALTAGLAAGAASCSPKPKLTPYSSISQGSTGVFAHGVASGDPGATSVVIWTRITPADAASADGYVVWEIAADENFTDMRGKGEAQTGAARDWTVKALVPDLAPGETYYYRFRAGDVVSPVGRTRTLPVGPLDQVRFAVITCSNFPFGYFNVYDLLSRQDDIQAIIHLGDYIYEYGRDGYGGETGAKLGREHEPAHEIVTLADYRTRHAQYKADPASQAAHAAHPLIPIWDDHETSNNSWKDGAENHQPETEGDWETRRRAALQAYYEWMPVREPTAAPEAFFRSFSFGDLLTIAAIETRLMARAKQFEYADIVKELSTPEDVDRFNREILWDDSREMLGAAQRAFIADTFAKSADAGQPWRLIANQVIMAKVIAPDLNPHLTEEELAELEKQWKPARAFVKTSALGLPTNFDAWDGYPAARERFYDIAKQYDGGMIVVTGDSHTWWANDLTDKQGGHVGVELGTHSVTSPSPYAKSFLAGKGAEYALLTNKENKDVRYISGEDHGFIDLVITRDVAKAKFTAVDTILERDYNAFTKAEFTIKRSDGAAKFAGAGAMSLKERLLFG